MTTNDLTPGKLYKTLVNTATPKGRGGPIKKNEICIFLYHKIKSTERYNIIEYHLLFENRHAILQLEEKYDDVSEVLSPIMEAV